MYSNIRLFLFSPTRLLANKLKGNWTKRHFFNWTELFLALASAQCIVIAIMVALIDPPLPVGWFLLFCLIPYSRINEVFIAFLFDSLHRACGVAPAHQDLDSAERIELVASSYLETMHNFGLIYYVYYLVFSDGFTKSFRDVYEAVYFSGVTIATLGYGDIAPSKPLSQVLSIYEVLIGIVLIVLAIGSYFADKHDTTPTK